MKRKKRNAPKWIPFWRLRASDVAINMFNDMQRNLELSIGRRRSYDKWIAFDVDNVEVAKKLNRLIIDLCKDVMGPAYFPNPDGCGWKVIARFKGRLP